MEQQWVRSSVAAMMARQPTEAEAALIRPYAALDLKQAFARLPARRGARPGRATPSIIPSSRSAPNIWPRTRVARRSAPSTSAWPASIGSAPKTPRPRHAPPSTDA